MSSLCHRNSLSVSVSQGDSSSDNHISYAHTKNITQTYISTLGIHMPYICHHMPYICQTYGIPRCTSVGYTLANLQNRSELN